MGSATGNLTLLMSVMFIIYIYKYHILPTIDIVPDNLWLEYSIFLLDGIYSQVRTVSSRMWREGIYLKTHLLCCSLSFVFTLQNKVQLPIKTRVITGFRSELRHIFGEQTQLAGK